MKKIFRAVSPLILALVAIGCHAQLPPTAPIYTCPAAPIGGTAYTPINPPANNTTAASITGTTYTDTPATGTYCYVVQSWALVAPATVYQDSAPSNVAGPFTTTATLAGVALSWTVPGATSGYTYVVSRTTATIAPAPLAPALSQPTGVALLNVPKRTELADVRVPHWLTAAGTL